MIVPNIKNLICLKNIWKSCRSLLYKLYTFFFNHDTKANKLALQKYLLYNPAQSSQLKWNAVKPRDSKIDSWDRGAQREEGKGYIRSEDKSSFPCIQECFTSHSLPPGVLMCSQHVNILGPFTSNQNKHIHCRQNKAHLLLLLKMISSLA